MWFGGCFTLRCRVSVAGCGEGLCDVRKWLKAGPGMPTRFGGGLAWQVRPAEGVATGTGTGPAAAPFLSAVAPHPYPLCPQLPKAFRCEGLSGS